MLAASLITKKRDGQALADDEIRFLIEGFCDGTVPDYQMSALAMAICLKGMNSRETATLTVAMLESGDRLPRNDPDRRGTVVSRPRVDKHSTGGLGDKVSLVLAPLLAVCDVDVPMISGRGLGLSGGTLDKLESIPGFQTALDEEAASKVLEDVGAFIISASERIAPADRQLYALRDVTGTVESIPLITASILSKKLAANLDALVMDVKVGQAAFMKSLREAKQLAKSIIQVADQSGLPTSAILSDMDQPLGCSVGNANEVNEAIDILDGTGPPEVRELTIELSVNLLVQTGVVRDHDHARERLARRLDDGSAMERFRKMIHAQGGRLDGKLQLATCGVVVAQESGYVNGFDCQAIGRAIVAMGGGRQRLGDQIDPRVGIDVNVRRGDWVAQGDRIFTVYCDCFESVAELDTIGNAVEIVDAPVEKNALIIDRFEGGKFA